jgi:DNA-binding MarR family transcriptional regulator
MAVNEEERNVEMQRLAADLFQAASAMRRDGEAIARQAGQTQARWQVMWIAATGRHTVPAIGRRLGITRQSAQRTATELVRDGVAEFKPNLDHATSPLLLLTPHGTAILEQINSTSAQRHLQVVALLGDTAVRQLRRRLGQLTATLAHTPRPDPAADSAR